MRTRTLLALTLVAITLLSSLALPSLAVLGAFRAAAPSASAPAAPHVLVDAGTGTQTVVPENPAYIGACTSIVDNTTYQSDFAVTFNPYTGLPALPTVPTVSQYARAVGVTVSPSSSAITLNQVVLTVWAQIWNSTTDPTLPPSLPGTWNLPIVNGSASGLLNDEKYFPPGTTVYFNLTIVFSNSSGVDQTVYSPCPMGNLPSTANAAPTWEYLVSGGWPSTTVGGFQSAIKITATPNVFAGVQPGPEQAVVFKLNSVLGNPIGVAYIYYNISYYDNLTGATSAPTPPNGGGTFTPVNTSSESVSVGPYPNPGNYTTIHFYIVAYEDWSGGVVNMIQSSNYTYVVGTGGTWCNAKQPFSSYLTVSTSTGSYPDAAPSGAYALITYIDPNTGLPANPGLDPLSAVNVTLNTVSANTTISYANVFFNVTYQHAKQPQSHVPMNRLNATSQYTGDLTQQQSLANWNPSVLGPFPPGVQVSFYVVAADLLGCTIQSPVYEFHTNMTGSPVVNDRTYFWVAAYDVGKNTYASGAQVTFSNATWVDHTQTSLLGFAYPNVTGSNAPAYLAINCPTPSNPGANCNYNVSVTYDNYTQFVVYTLTASSNKTLTFYFDTSSSSNQNITYAEPVPWFAGPIPSISWPLLIGLLIAAAGVIPVYFLWSDLRRQAEAEEKRITL